MKRFLVFPVLLLLNLSAPAQKRISVLTCGTGQELYSLFGHAAIRIVDTMRGTDEVYNYGTFNGFEEDFEIKYMRGKLLYYLAKEDFLGFLQTYIAEGRSVQEKVLNLDSVQEEQLYQALEENLLPQNAAYKYDFLYDNCATRIRDIFPKALGEVYKAGGADSIPYTTFRNSIDEYTRPRPWERFGIDLLLGSPVDQRVSPMTMQYLPDYLRSGIENSTLNNKPFAQPLQQILPAASQPEKPMNGPLLLNVAMLVMGLTLWMIKPLRPAAEAFARIIFALTGLLGVLILFMWFGTDHQACGYNWNFLWTLPTGIVAAFLPKNCLRRYSLWAMGITVLSFLFPLLGIQEFPLRDAWPLIVLLLLHYGMIYKQSACRKTS